MTNRELLTSQVALALQQAEAWANGAADAADGMMNDLSTPEKQDKLRETVGEVAQAAAALVVLQSVKEILSA